MSSWSCGSETVATVVQVLPSGETSTFSPALSVGPVTAVPPGVDDAIASTGGRVTDIEPSATEWPRSTVTAVPGFSASQVVVSVPSSADCGGSAVAGDAVAGWQRATSSVGDVSGGRGGVVTVCPVASDSV